MKTLDLYRNIFIYKYKLSLFSFINSAIVPYVSTLIRYDSWTYQNLVTTISTTIVIGSIVSLLTSIIWKKI